MTNLVPESEQQYGSILTVLGENAEQNGKLLNKQIVFTHIAFGDANDTYVQPDRKAQGLVNELHRIPVNSVDVLQATPDSVPILKVEAILPDDINDVVIREFAAVAEFNGQSYFHAIGNCARIYVPRPINNGNVSNPVILEMTFVITSAEPIVLIDPNVVTASREWVDERLNKEQKKIGYVDAYGAKGDALISMAKPLYYLINGVENLTNPDATDDTEAIKKAIEECHIVNFTGGKGYLVSDCFPFGDSNKSILGHGAAIVYRGGRTPGRDITGIFQPQGIYDRFESQADIVSGIDVFKNKLQVSKLTNKLKKGDYTLFYAHNGVTDFDNEVLKYAYYVTQVRNVKDLGANAELSLDYKAGFSWLADEIQLGFAKPIDNVVISDFILIDEMLATKTPDVLPVPEAPSNEKDIAVGLVYAKCISNSKFSRLKSYNAKYSTLTVFCGNNCVDEDIQTFTPVWFGGGEGYSCRLVTSIYHKSLRPSMIGGRHVIDYTTCGHCKVKDSHCDSDQVSFSMHTQSEHDIVFENCVGGDFYLANGQYGYSCIRVTLDNCTFTKVRINCLHLTILNSQLNDFQSRCSKVTIKNTNITEFCYLDKDDRHGADDILSEYTDVGKLFIDEQSSIKRKSGYTRGTSISGWYYARLSNRWSSDVDDSRYSLVVSDVANFQTDGDYRETNIYVTGLSRSIDTRGTTATISSQSYDAPFIAMDSLNVPIDETLSMRVGAMDLKLNGKMRPFQIIGKDSYLNTINAIVSGGGSVFKNCQQASITDKSDNHKMTFKGLSYTYDAYDNGLSTQVESKDKSLQYKEGLIYPGKGTAGVPAWWDGSQFIDL